MGAGNEQQARLVESVALNEEIKHYVFESLDKPRFDFEPGQHVCFVKSFDGNRTERYYSLASAPNGSNRFEVCLNPVRDRSPFGEYLRLMQPGEVLEYQGPAGSFLLNDPLKESVFLTNGTGIAPIRSMLLYLLKNEKGGTSSVPLTLIQGARSPEWLLYGDDFEALAIRHPRFRFWPTLSRPTNGWKGRQGYVQTHLQTVLEKPDVERDFYLCGRPEMVDEVRRRLGQAGFHKSAVRYERHG